MNMYPKPCVGILEREKVHDRYGSGVCLCLSKDVCDCVCMGTPKPLVAENMMSTISFRW